MRQSITDSTSSAQPQPLPVSIRNEALERGLRFHLCCRRSASAIYSEGVFWPGCCQDLSIPRRYDDRFLPGFAADAPAYMADKFICPQTRKWRNWQTHQLEGLAIAISWGFESPLPHQPSLTLVKQSVSYGWQATRRLSAVALAKADRHPLLRSRVGGQARAERAGDRSAGSRPPYLLNPPNLRAADSRNLGQ